MVARMQVPATSHRSDGALSIDVAFVDSPCTPAVKVVDVAVIDQPLPEPDASFTSNACVWDFTWSEPSRLIGGKTMSAGVLFTNDSEPAFTTSLAEEAHAAGAANARAAAQQVAAVSSAVVSRWRGRECNDMGCDGQT